MTAARPPLASVFTPSHNKGALAAEAVLSVLGQDFDDWEYWIIENSTDGTTRDLLAPLAADPRVRYEQVDLAPAERERSYATAVLLNRYYPKAAGKYVFYLSDDDLLEPSCLRRCVEFLESDPSRSVCWFSLKVVTLDGAHHPREGAGIEATHALGRGTDYPRVDCVIDGGQIAHRRDCLDALGQPYFPESGSVHDARHCDGLFMQKLADRFTFWPLPEWLATHRATPLSTFDRLR